MKKSLLLLLLVLFALPQAMRADDKIASLLTGYCGETPYMGMAMGDAKQEAIVGVRFDEEFVKRYAGCQVTSIRVCMSGVVGATAGVFLFPDSQRPEDIPHTTDPSDARADDWYKAAQGKTSEFAYHFPYEEWIDLPDRTDTAAREAMAWQWVEVPLSHPYTIDPNTAFFAGFRSYPPIAGASNSVIALSGDGETNEHSWVYFPNSDNWTKWAQLMETNMSELGVNLMIQVRISGDDLPTNDIALAAINGPSFLKTGEFYDYECVIQNMATDKLKDFMLSYWIDGMEIVKDKHMEFQNGLNYQEYGGFKITDVFFTEPGMHHIEMTVSMPNGEEDRNPKDNTFVKSVEVYNPEDAVARRVLVESFSTASCGNCPGAHEREREAFEGTDAIEVCHHSGFYTDPFTTDADLEYTWFFNMGGSTFAPAIMMDRTNVNDFYATGYPGPVFLPGAPSELKSIHATLKDVPATVGVDINGAFDSTTRELTVTVSGKVLAIPKGSDHRLHVWLIENNLKCKQPQSGSSEGLNYIHQHVFRETLTGVWGTVMNLKSSDYSETYTFTVPAGWDADNIEIVAFLSNLDGYDATNCKVYNANKVALTSLLSDGIANVPGSAFPTNTYYNLAGQRTGANAQGISVARSMNAAGDVIVRKIVK